VHPNPRASRRLLRARNEPDALACLLLWRTCRRCIACRAAAACWHAPRRAAARACAAAATAVAANGHSQRCCAHARARPLTHPRTQRNQEHTNKRIQTPWMHTKQQQSTAQMRLPAHSR
jgi:hypothetical protein